MPYTHICISVCMYVYMYVRMDASILIGRFVALFIFVFWRFFCHRLANIDSQAPKNRDPSFVPQKTKWHFLENSSNGLIKFHQFVETISLIFLLLVG
jgi:hypothetical protein